MPPLKAGLARARSLAWRARGEPGRALPGVRILFYHRVSVDRDPLAVTPARFRRQMAYLAEHGFRVVDVAEAGRLLASGRRVDRVIGLSFDDGYRDVADHALPALEGYGFSASVFVVPGVIDGRAAFTWYRRMPPLLGWGEIERLDGGSALRFEAHTLTHPDLTSVPEARAREEIAGSKRELEHRLGREVEAFCYPAGLFGRRERALVAEAGFRVAVSCEPGINDDATDPLALHRIQVERSDVLLDFRARVGGGHDAQLPLRAAYRRLRHGRRAA
ncbi:MAG: polysaccharide deacetylase family protein [Gaiellales bacterium]